MADLSKTVKILFLGEDQISKTMADISGKVDVFSSTIESIANPLAGVADGILKTDAALMALATGGIVYSVLKFRDFEDVMLKVKGILGANEAEYQSLMEVTKNLGATTKFTATEAAQGLEFLALAGFSTTEAIKAIPEVLNLAQASALDLGQAADIVTNIMAGYGVKVENLGRANDVLTATFTNSNTSLDQLGQAFKMVGPVAKSLGLDLSETSSILGVLGNAGYQAEMGGTALRNILLALVAPAGNMGKLMKELGVDTNELGVDLSSSKNALKSLGVEVKNSEGNLRPFADIMDDIKIGLEKIPDPADRTATLIEIFGKRGGPQLAALLEQGSGAVRGLEDKINSLGGVTADIAQTMESGIGGALRSFKSALEAISLTIGENLGEALKGTVQGATEIERALNQMVKDGTFDSLFTEVGKFGDDLEEYLKEIAQALPDAFKNVDFQELIKALQGVGTSVSGLFDGIDLTTPDGLAKAVQAVIDTLRSLANVTAGMIDGIKPFFETIKGMATSFNSLDTESQKSAGNILGLAKAVSEAGFKIAAAMMVIGENADALTGIFEMVINGTMVLFDGVVLTWNTAKLAFIEILDDLLAASQVFDSIFLFGAFSKNIDAARLSVGIWADETRQNMWDAANDAIAHSGKIVEGFTKIGKSADDSQEHVNATTGKIKDFTVLAAGYFDNIPDSKKTDYLIDSDPNEIQKIFENLNKLPEEKQLLIKSLMDAGMYQAAADMIDEIPTEKKLSVLSEADKKSFTDTQNYIDVTLPDGTINRIYVKPEADAKSTDKAAQDVKDKLDPLKILDIQSKVDIAKIEKDAKSIEAAFGTINTQIEWDAKIDIAALEADAKIAEAMFNSLGDSVSSVADTTASMFGDITGALNSVHFNELYKILTQQVNIEDKLVDAQIALINARTKAYNDGTATTVTLNAGDAQPQMVAMMYELIRQVQLDISQNGEPLLLGDAAV